MASYRIDVTAEDIAEGVEKNCYACPIAKAIKRCVPEADSPKVDRWSAGWYDGGRAVQVPLPASASLFVQAFDSGESVEPFVFTLEVA